MLVSAMSNDPLDLHRRRGPSTSSAPRRRRMGAVARMAKPAGRFGGGSRASVPFPRKGLRAVRRRRSGLPCSLRSGSSPARRRRAVPALSTCDRLSLRPTATRSGSTLRALLVFPRDFLPVCDARPASSRTMSHHFVRLLRDSLGMSACPLGMPTFAHGSWPASRRPRDRNLTGHLQDASR